MVGCSWEKYYRGGRGSPISHKLELMFEVISRRVPAVMQMAAVTVHSEFGTDGKYLDLRIKT